MTPKILVETDNPDRPSFQNYVNAVKSAGGEPLVATPSNQVEISRVQGVLLTGGFDIDPERYGEGFHPRTQLLPKAREEFVLNLARKCYEKKKPALAVCLGCQVVNVALGGTLYQHIAGHSDSTHDVYFTDMRGLRIFEKEIPAVNSYHHQSIKRLSAKLVPCAFSSDNVLEMALAPDHPFYVAIQWHPERMQSRPDQQLLFKKFVASCKPTVPTVGK